MPRTRLLVAAGAPSDSSARTMGVLPEFAAESRGVRPSTPGCVRLQPTLTSALNAAAISASVGCAPSSKERSAKVSITLSPIVSRAPSATSREIMRTRRTAEEANVAAQRVESPSTSPSIDAPACTSRCTIRVDHFAA